MNLHSIANDLRQTVDAAKAKLVALDAKTVTHRPAADRWTIAEVVGHLIDSAANNHQRFVRAALQGELTFPGYEQDKLVDLQNFREMDWDFLVDLWTSYNRFLAHVLAVLPANAAGIICDIGSSAPATL